MSEENSKFPEKFAKKLPTGFSDTVDSADSNQLKKIIVECEGNIYTINKEKAADVKLNGAKELIKDLSAPYREAAQAQAAKIQYCLYVLENRGVNLDNNESAD